MAEGDDHSLTTTGDTTPEANTIVRLIQARLISANDHLELINRIISIDALNQPSQPERLLEEAATQTLDITSSSQALIQTHTEHMHANIHPANLPEIDVQVPYGKAEDITVTIPKNLSGGMRKIKGNPTESEEDDIQLTDDQQSVLNKAVQLKIQRSSNTNDFQLICIDEHGQRSEAIPLRPNPLKPQSSFNQFFFELDYNYENDLGVRIDINTTQEESNVIFAGVYQNFHDAFSDRKVDRHLHSFIYGVGINTDGITAAIHRHIPSDPDAGSTSLHIEGFRGGQLISQLSDILDHDGGYPELENVIMQYDENFWRFVIGRWTKLPSYKGNWYPKIPNIEFEN